jgi:hypothetical protein
VNNSFTPKIGEMSFPWFYIKLFGFFHGYATSVSSQHGLMDHYRSVKSSPADVLYTGRRIHLKLAMALSQQMLNSGKVFFADVKLFCKLGSGSIS